MQTQPIIRNVKQIDLDELVILCKEHASYEKAAYSTKNKKQLLLKHLFCEPKTLYCLVIELNEKLIGYVTYMKQFSTWDGKFYIYMDCLFLSEMSRGFGLGKKIMNQLKIDAKKLDCSLIQWQTPNFNEGAINFYNKIGAVSKTKERFFLELSD